jgi:RNA polymerase sigma-70 factor (ECF subfamily)
MVEEFKEPSGAPDSTSVGDGPGGGAAPSLPRETLVAVRNGDPRALGEFFEFSFDRVYSLAARLLGDKTAAEDATQEVFIKVQRAAGKLDPDRNPLPWLTVITYNVCRDHLRSRGRQATKTVSIDIDPASAERVVSTGPDPEAAALASERSRLVQEALLRLPEDLRAIIILRDYDGMRHEEIAEVVGASHAAVRKRYSRALAKLADELKGVLNE